MVLEKDILQNNLDKLISSIEKSRLKVNPHHIVKIVVVSKYTSIENIQTLYSLGQRAFGENQVQQLKERALELENLPIEWHMVGTLQKNKINNLISLNPSLLHSLDNLSLAQELDKKLKTQNKTMKALLQINSSKEKTKSGVLVEEAYNTYQEIEERFKNIKLQGVMSIGANSEDKNLVKNSFEDTFKVYEKLKGATICSMGMSSDFQLAIENGSNLIRVGSLLFK